MPPQDYIMKVLWLCFVLVVVAYFGSSEAVALKRSGLAENIPQQEINVQDDFARELRALPGMPKSPVAPENVKAPGGKEISKPEVGYNEAAMLFMKRYVNALYDRPQNIHNNLRKKSIYGPGMYPFYGMYGKRATEDPQFGYTPEVLDMIRGLITRTEASALRNRKLEELAKDFQKSNPSEELKETKGSDEELNHEESQELNQVEHPKAGSKDNEDRAAKVTAYEDDANEKELEEMVDPEESPGH